MFVEVDTDPGSGAEEGFVVLGTEQDSVQESDFPAQMAD